MICPFGLYDQGDNNVIILKRILPAALAALMLTACGDTSKVDSLISQNEKAGTSSSEASVSDSSADGQTTAASDPIDIAGIDVSNGNIDVDLTGLESNIVYAQVFDMVNNPDNYTDKTVKAHGTFAHTTDESGEKDYFAVFIADASACCQQGIEFVWAGDHKYPDDYPEEGKEITVVGKFGTYTEGEYQYCVLTDAQMTIGKA